MIEVTVKENETLKLEISSEQEFNLNNGTKLDNKFLLEKGDLEGLEITIPKNIDSFDLLVKAIAKQETSQNSKVEIIRVNVNPLWKIN